MMPAAVGFDPTRLQVVDVALQDDHQSLQDAYLKLDRRGRRIVQDSTRLTISVLEGLGLDHVGLGMRLVYIIQRSFPYLRGEYPSFNTPAPELNAKSIGRACLQVVSQSQFLFTPLELTKVCSKLQVMPQRVLDLMPSGWISVEASLKQIYIVALACFAFTELVHMYQTSEKDWLKAGHNFALMVGACTVALGIFSIANYAMPASMSIGLYRLYRDPKLSF